MSGPKVSAVELEKQRQIRLEQERQEKLKQLRAAMAELETVRNMISESIWEIDRQFEALLLQTQDQTVIQPTVNALLECKIAYKNSMYALLQEAVPTETQNIRELSKQLKQAQIERFAEYRNKTTALFEIVNRWLAEEAPPEIESMNLEDVDFAKIRFIIRNREQLLHSDIQLADTLITNITNLIISENISPDNENDLRRFAKELQDSLEQNEDVTDLLSKGQEKLTAITKSAALFEKEYQEYCTLYVEYFSMINSQSKNERDIVPKERYLFEGSLKKLYAERALLSAAVKEIDERRYIRAQIDDIMREVGYKTTTEICLDKNENSANYMCKKIDENTAVHIRLTDNGMMMEISGNESATRPDACSKNASAYKANHESLSEKEKNRLLEAQGEFCKLYPDIVNKLKARGVILHEVKYNEPSTEYCNIIYNIDDNWTDHNWETHIENKLINKADKRKARDKVLSERAAK